MLNKLQQWFFGFWVKKYRVSFLMLFLIIIAGIFAVIQIPKESNPEIKFGIIQVMVNYPWVNPVDMDSLITDKIEKEIKDIEGIKKIGSTSSVGRSGITVELYNGIDTSKVLSDIKDKVDAMDLPEDANDPLVVEIATKSDLMFQVVLYWEADKHSNFELKQRAKQIEKDLEWKYSIATIDVWWVTSNGPDASSVSVGEYEIKVLISKAKLELLWLSIGQITNTIRNYNKNIPIWSYQIGDLNYDFRIEWELKDENELANLIVKDTGWSRIQLKDIAQIKKQYKDEPIKTLWFYQKTGLNYITLDLNKKDWANIFNSSKKAKKWLEEYLASHKKFKGLEKLYIKDMSELIIEDYDNLSSTALTTIVLVFIVILLFVGTIESIIATLLLPLAFFGTFIILDTLGYSLNFLTNFSLVLTLWIAIDTIIVIIEWASERRKLWYERRAAVLLAIRDLKSPLISGTMTTLVAFLPLMFLPGIMGKFLSFIPITVFATLVWALILSLTLSSALFSKLVRKSKFYHKDSNYESGLSSEEREFLIEERKGKQAYKHDTSPLRDRSLNSLRDGVLNTMGSAYYKQLHYFVSKSSLRLLSIFVPIILLVLTFVFLSPKIWFTIFPATDNNVMNIQVTGANGGTKESLQKYLPLIDDSISQYKELKVYYSSISWNRINTYIELTDRIGRQDRGERSVFEIEKLITKDLEPLKSEWLEVEFLVEEWGPPSGKAVWIKLITDDANNVNELKNIADDFKEFLTTVEWTKNITVSSSDTPGQFVFSFNKNKLSYVWLEPSDITNELYFYTSWVTAGSIKSAYEDNDIVISLAEFEDTLTPEDISNLVINTKVWKIKVGDYLNVKFDKSLSSISREDGKIIIAAEADVLDGFLPTDVQPQFVEFAKNYHFPEWFSYNAGWENEEQKDLIISVVKSFFIAIFLIFTILVLQFNSYSRPVIILYSVVLAFLWVNVWLYLTWNPYSMPFAIWFIALMWVVVNDAIILIDRISKNISRLERHNTSPTKDQYLDALVSAWKSRLQPIIVTTLTTLFWVLPLALQDAFWAGLWFTIIFWLFAWSFMTLFVIPSLYYQVYLRKK